jgi:monofunctional biosynthetic peptidoglycan transglycosylase
MCQFDMTAVIKRFGWLLGMILSLQSVDAKTLPFSNLEVFPRAAIVNDSVMGGVSVSTLTPEDDYRRFTGNVRLENNGGFASVRFLVADELPNADMVQLRVKGDGKIYQLRFRMAGAWQSIAYSVNFQTMNDAWQTFEFNTADFQPVWRGRNVRNAPALALESVQQVSVFIADKQVGEFNILLDSLAFQGNS